ncbi:metal ABC transporter ATP-binding protein [Candidatus Dojkabacteria bacterium]|uniref:Metal ABC transporter ATP-binding protein n=1 Tax=Candidatus Dojkabacteria bacterium TaxID=2099670 RepID=A0A955I9D8_9BACT|nr:metal ABC transporter ATP-binding protein [Candidatus Dojkabacteria bacterium]
MNKEVIIKVENINYSYNSIKVLENVSFDVNRGDYIGIIGPNGSGKSTLLKIILGLIKPDKGSITISGKKLSNGLDSCRVGYVSQRISQESQDLPATVYEIVESGLVAKEKLFSNGEKHREKILNAISISGLKGKEDKLIGQLSGGQRQKAFVARAIASDPQILILDEPFVGVDLASQDEFYRFLRKLNVEKGLTIIFVSHDIDIISGQASRMIALNRTIVYTGEAEKLDEKKLVDNIYGQKFTHIHHDR